MPCHARKRVSPFRSKRFMSESSGI
jgi:hypothetical protein